MSYRATRVGGCLEATVDRRADGAVELRSTETLGDYPQRLTDRLEHWAREAPERTFVARRDPSVPGGGGWIHISYAEMLERARRIGQALVDRGLSAERPVVILSDNDIEHLSLVMGAMWVGVPVVPVSSAYSLVAQDPAKLRHIVGTVTPGLIFASGAEYARAIGAVAGPGVEVVLTQGQASSCATTAFAALLAVTPCASGDAAHAQVGPHTIAKFLFTSGSTKNPKGVINTQRMLCANQQMLAQALAFLTDEPPVLVDWLPWNHTFGGNHNVGIALYNGGTLYIDDGKPTPRGMATTLRNLREIAPTIYFNVPKGFEELAAAMEGDAPLRERLFSRVKAFMYAGAGLSQAVWDQLNRLALQTVGERIPIITGLGMTETAPSCTFAVHYATLRSGHIGLPCPGVEVKLLTDGDGAHPKTEIRFRGPNVMPGYWREPELTAQAFDEEGYYRTGDAVRWVDAVEPQRGLLFDGRLAEDFKLDTGTFVSVGPLRAKVVAEGAPCVQDVVVAGLNRAEIAILVFPRLDECARLAGLPASVDAARLLGHAAVRAFFQDMADRLWHAGTGSANRVARVLVMGEPPSIDKGEVTDKGSINQRAVLAQRTALVEDIYAGSAPGLLLPQRG
ncbi:MAG: feruloyl-CoA synthase [Pseudomonadota bacterium]